MTSPPTSRFSHDGIDLPPLKKKPVKAHPEQTLGFPRNSGPDVYEIFLDLHKKQKTPLP